MQVALDRFDNELLGQKIEVIVRDSGTNPNEAVPATEEIIRNEDPDVLIGGFSSSVVLALMEIAKREEIPYLSPGGANDNITGEDCNRYTFAKLACGHQYGGAGITMVEEDIANSFFFVVPDYAGGVGAYEAMTDILERETDAELLGSVKAALGNDDYSTQIQQARNSGADCVWNFSVGADTITWMNQAHSAGLDEDTSIGSGVFTLLEARGVDINALTGNYVGVPFYHELESSLEFVDEYQQRYGRPPHSWAAEAFDCCMEAFDAIKRTGSKNADDFIDALEGNEFSWSRSNQKWRACDHRAIQPYYLGEGIDGEGDNFLDIVGSREGEAIMRSCSDTGCSL